MLSAQTDQTSQPANGVDFCMFCHWTYHVELQMSLRCNNPHLLQLTSLQHIRQFQLKDKKDQAVLGSLERLTLQRTKLLVKKFRPGRLQPLEAAAV